SHPIGLHAEGGVYDLFWDQPPGGDRHAMASLLMTSAAQLVRTYPWHILCPKFDTPQSSGIVALPAALNADLTLMPCCVSSQNPMEIFILLQEAIASKDAEVEFSGNKQRVRVKPVNWNESTLKVTAPDFTAGHVIVTLYSKGLVKGNACLQYYTIMEDIAHFLQQAADPVKFMCQVSTCLRNLFFPFPECHSEDIPTLLHFAAQHGLRDLASALLQCPGSRQALKIPNSHGHTPLDLAHVHGHNQLYILLQDTNRHNTAAVSNQTTCVPCLSPTEPCSGPPLPSEPGMAKQTSNEPGFGVKHARTRFRSPSEHQNNEGENVYTPLGRDGEEYDTILTSSSSVVIVNRPPAPTPRPDSLPTPEDKTPFIAQVFQKKKSQGDAETLPRDSISTTYDTFVPSQPPGLDELIKLQQEVKMGSLSIDDALDRFNDWQRLQKGMDSIQQVMDMVNPLEFL
uniref:DBB domain-containing protein n=1 Tax=Sinocyclocheilus rhinocerous TaxID=307959 RepID=A0A673N2S9_9TELE